MTTLVKADDKGRVPIRGTKKQGRYLVTATGKGWWVIPAPEIKPPDASETAPLVKPRRAKNGLLMIPLKLDKAKVAAALRADRDRR